MRPWRSCEPDMIPFRRGWLARTPRDHPYRVAVEGSSEEDARRRFHAAMAAWKELHELAEYEAQRIQELASA